MNGNEFAKELAEMFDGVEISDADLERVAGGKWEALNEYLKELQKKYGDTLNVFAVTKTLTQEELDKFQELYREAQGK